MQSAFSAYRYVDAEFLAQIERLDFMPRHYSVGWLPGRHHSPFRGTSVEFAEHRGYTPGDDIRQIDWRVYARHERYTIRQHEGETRTSVHILLDTSASMDYGDPSKFEFAVRLALGFAYLILRQQDAVSLWHSGEAVGLPPTSGPAQFHRFAKLVDQLNPKGKRRVSKVLEDVVHRVPPHGLWIVLSDCLESIESLEHALQYTRYRGHEVILWHLLHPDEIEMPFTGTTEFVGYEGGRMRFQPEQFREAYRTSVERFRQKLRLTCHSESIDYISPDITEPVVSVFTEYLTQRSYHRHATHP